MKAESARLALAICITSLVVAEPSCPQSGDTETGIYFPHPTDCSKFLTCHWGNLLELSCPSATFWNDAIKACDLQEHVVCSAHPEPTSVAPTTAEPATTTTELATTTSTTAAPSTNPSPNGQCPDFYDPNNQVFLPHTDCSKYYICTWGGVAVEQNCPPNLHWNQQHSICDYPEQAGCMSVNPTTDPTLAPTTTTTSVPTTTVTSEPSTPTPTTTSTTASTGNCPAVNDPNHQIYFPHPTDCSKFLTCHWGNLVELSCPSATFWNDAIKACDFQEHVICSSQPEPTSITVPTTAEPAATTTELSTTSSTTAAPSTNPSPSEQCPDFYDPNHQVFLPHADCSKYYICIGGGVAVEQNCPPNLHWNQQLSNCDYPEQAGCLYPTLVPSTPAPATTAPNENCPAVNDPNHQIFLPHPTDCSKFLTCHWGNLVELSCPSDTFWNDAIKVCDPNVVCTQQSEATSAEPATPTTTAAPSTNPTESDQCPEIYDPHHQVYFPHADCTKYYICTFEGNKLEQNCPVGLHWSQPHSYCNYPELVQCTPPK